MEAFDRLRNKGYKDKIISTIKKKWKGGRIVVICICIVLLSIWIAEMPRKGNQEISEVIGLKGLDNSVEYKDIIANKTELSGAKELEIRKVKEQREYGRITTVLFEVYAEEEGSLLDTHILNSKRVIEEIQSYIDTIHNKVEAIGLVGDEFYVQINKEKEVKDQHIGIVSLDDNFSINDWYSLTEGIYDSVDVQAECLCEFQDEKASKHYLYVYVNK